MRNGRLSLPANFQVKNPKNRLIIVKIISRIEMILAKSNLKPEIEAVLLKLAFPISVFFSGREGGGHGLLGLKRSISKFNHDEQLQFKYFVVFLSITLYSLYKKLVASGYSFIKNLRNTLVQEEGLSLKFFTLTSRRNSWFKKVPLELILCTTCFLLLYC